VLGDSPAVGVLLEEHGFCFHERRAPRIDEAMHYVHEQSNRKIRVYEYIDSRFILEDFYSKLALFGADRGRG
jgi:purine nucleosidase